MADKIVVETERLYVRTWQQSDVEPLYRVMSDEILHKYTTEAPWSLEETRQFVKQCIRAGYGAAPGFFNCPLILKSNNELIGHVGLNRLGKEYLVPEIEWMISPQHWGKGYATEIGNAMLQYGFQQAAFELILGFAVPENVASRRVMEKIGMTFAGVREWRGQLWARYEAKRSHWPPTRPEPLP